MHCPRCRHSDFVSDWTCPRCGFHGDPGQIEELSQLDWLLSEMDTWVGQGVLKNFPKRLQKHYQARRQDVKSDLGLTYIPFTPEEAKKAWVELRHYEILFEQIEKWLEAGWVKSGLLPTHYARLLELQARLEGDIRPQVEASSSTRMEEITFLEGVVQRPILRDDFISVEAHGKAVSHLLAEKARLESALKPPVEKEAEKSSKPTKTPHPPTPEPAPAVPAPLRPPLHERLWSSILSERTLQALLFLGIFLLFVAAISFVVWGWEDFPPPVRVAIPFGFTALFFVIGQVVRAKTHLERSALALSAIAALLIPIDSYTIYANFGEEGAQPAILCWTKPIDRGTSDCDPPRFDRRGIGRTGWGFLDR